MQVKLILSFCFLVSVSVSEAQFWKKDKTETSTEAKKDEPKKKIVTKKTKVVEPKKPVEIEGLAEPEQPLFYYGPPPAIKALYKKLEFDKDFHPMDLMKHMGEGSSPSEICAAWGITYSKFNEWLDECPELAEAYAVGKPSYDAYYKRALRLSLQRVALIWMALISQTWPPLKRGQRI